VLLTTSVFGLTGRYIWFQYMCFFLLVDSLIFFVQCWGWNPGPNAYQVNVLHLSCIPDLACLHSLQLFSLPALTNKYTLRDNKLTFQRTAKHRTIFNFIDSLFFQYISYLKYIFNKRQMTTTQKFFSTNMKEY
jgi:hypothetical protein